MIRKLTLLAVAAALLVPANVGAHPGDCPARGHETFAKFLQPQDGMAQVQTGPTGALTILTGGPVPAVFVSTTGTIEVKIEYACLKSLTLTAENTSDDVLPIYTRSWDSDCEHAEKTDQVEVGLQAGNYEFTLSGTTCSGVPIKSDGRNGFVADPPLI